MYCRTMNLKQYLEKTKKSYLDLAKDLDIHQVYANAIVSGLNHPGPKLTMRISKWTGGKVTKKELRPDLWG